jgi:PTS system cellobiose-specific IIC component
MMQKVSPVFQKLGNNAYLQTISASMMGTLTPIIIGSIAVLLLVFPITAVQNAVAALELSGILSNVNSLTIGSMSLYVAFLMSRNLVNKFIPEEDGVLAGVMGLMSFLILTPLGTTTEDATAIPTTWLGAQGVFSAMIVGLFVGRIFVLFRQKNLTVKMPDSVPPMVTKVFDSLFPGLTVGFIVIVVAKLFALTSFGSMHQFIYTIIQEPLKGIGGSIGAIIICSLIQQILWFFGIHGTNVIMPIVQPLWLAMDAENLTALAAGQPLPNIGGYAFFNIITWGGTALGLVLLMLISKSSQYKQLGRVAIIPALFGITEPVIFGTPLVLNFKLAFPFITNNTICLLISYLLMKAGIVARCAGTTTIFGMPLGFYAITGGSVSIIILHLIIQLVISPILWFPWFKMVEKEAIQRENETR